MDAAEITWGRTRPSGMLRHAVWEQGGGIQGTCIRPALCGRGSNGMSNAGQPFDPAHPDSCRRCAVVYAARCLDPAPGLTKACATCNRDQPANKFTADARTRDGLSSNCFDCRNKMRALREQANTVTYQAAARAEWHERSCRAAESRARDFARFQGEAPLPFLCTIDPAHGALVATAREAEVLLSCPACGWAEPADYKLWDYAKAVLALGSDGQRLVRGSVAALR